MSLNCSTVYVYTEFDSLPRVPPASRSSAASCIPPSCVHGAASMQRGTEDAKSMHKTTNYKTIRIRPPSPGILLSEGSDDVLSNCMHHARTGRVDEAMFRRPPCVMKSLPRVVSIRQYLYEPPARRLWRRPRGALCVFYLVPPHSFPFPPFELSFSSPHDFYVRHTPNCTRCAQAPRIMYTGVCLLSGQ